ncbi:MAG: thioredoxin-disulfide reductase [Treponema sp.]|jgi:thioredoxin reductase (NADPH)|nr:thioredoxin-disulfide reductase [Treponema sp.]
MNTSDAELIILGGGPAGLTAAQYGARANLQVLVVEQLAPGGQALLIDKLENYPGIPPDTSGYDFAGGLRRQAEEFGAAFLSDSVLSLTKEGNCFRLILGSGGTLEAPAVIIATGAEHRVLDIPGEAEFYGRGVSYCATCDGPFFKNKKIFVVGGGDAACDEARYLSRFSPQVVLIHRRDRFRAQKAIAERTLNNPNIKARFNTRMLEIRGDGQVSSVVLERVDTGGRYEEDAAAVFIFTGTVPRTAFVSGLGSDAGAVLEFDENGYIVTDQTMATALPGLFAAGDVRAAPFRQVVVAAGEGAVAAHSAAAYIDALKGEAYR